MYRALEAADRRAKPFRDFAAMAYKELVGRYYNHSDDQKRPLNLIARNTFTLQAHLAHKNPGHTVTTDYLPLRGEAKIREVVLDKISEDLERIRLSRMQLLRAMFSPYAVTKIGLRAGADLVKIDGKLYNPGQPYLVAIPFDDHLVDHEARCREEMQWEANRYRVPRGMAMDSGLFPPDVIRRLPSVSESRDSSRGGQNDKLSKTSGNSGDEAVEMIELIDIAFYDDSGTTIATMAGEQDGHDDFLMVADFQGPKRGPYEWLELYPIPDQLFGLPLVAMMMEGAELANKVLTKMCEQVLRTKRILAAERGQSDDLDTAEKSEDGASVEFDDINKVKNFDIGGLTPDFAPFSQQILAWSNMQYVNFDVAAGQEGGTDKATIYQGMQANLNVIIDDIQHTQETHEGRVSDQLHWYVDTDPMIQMGTKMRLPGGEFIDVQFDAATKQGTYQQFTTKIRYGSMLRQDPQVKAAMMPKIIETMMGSLQLTLSTGGAWKTESVARYLAQTYNIPEMDEFIDDPVLMQQLMMRMQSTPPHTQGQPMGQSQVNPQALYGGRPQPQGGAGRPQPSGAPKQMAGAV